MRLRVNISHLYKKKNEGQRSDKLKHNCNKLTNQTRSEFHDSILFYSILIKRAISHTPASNLGYLAPPSHSENFLRVPNCSLAPPECETKVSSKTFWYGLCENV